jgi:hypothetical protein
MHCAYRLEFFRYSKKWQDLSRNTVGQGKTVEYVILRLRPFEWAVHKPMKIQHYLRTTVELATRLATSNESPTSNYNAMLRDKSPRSTLKAPARSL